MFFVFIYNCKPKIMKLLDSSRFIFLNIGQFTKSSTTEMHCPLNNIDIYLTYFINKNFKNFGYFIIAILYTACQKQTFFYSNKNGQNIFRLLNLEFFKGFLWTSLIRNLQKCTLMWVKQVNFPKPNNCKFWCLKESI